MFMCTMDVKFAKLKTRYAYFVIKIDKLARDPPPNPKNNNRDC